MYTHSKILRNIVLSCLLLFGSIALFSQSVVINTSITPPYNIPFDNLKEQTYVIVTNTSRNQLNSGSLLLYIEGDNGIIVQSTSAFFDPILDVAPGVSVTFNGMNGDLDNLFNSNNLTFSGISSAVLFNSGLPPGNYSLCFQALDSDGGHISAGPPSGCSMFTVTGVTNVNVITQVAPPYNTDLLNYSNNIIVMLQSNVSGDVSLFMDIKGDNGVHLQTKESYLPNNIALEGTPLNVSAFDLGPYLDFQNLVSLGIPINEIQQKGLPPGQYQICVRVRTDDGGFVSGEEPAGCSNLFTINAVEPPQLINPVCGEEINSGSNNVVFSWTTPPGASPATTNYTLKIVELLPNQDPNQAFLSSTVPAFYEKSVFSQTSILYGVTDPLFENGKSYAWQVIAEDDELKTPFLNDGRSEVCWFTWSTQIGSQTGDDSGLNFKILSPSTNTDSFVVNAQQDLYLLWGWLYNGNYFNEDDLPLFKEKDLKNYRLSIHPGKVKSGHQTDQTFNYNTIITIKDTLSAISHFQHSAEELKAMGLKNDHWYSFEIEALKSDNTAIETLQTNDIKLALQEGISSEVAKISGQLRYSFENNTKDYPIPNTTIRFYPANNDPNNGQEYYTKTNADGAFELSVPLAETAQDSNAYQMEILSPYYQPIEKVVTIDATNKKIQLGQLITKAYNYSLKLNVVKGFNKTYKIANKESYYDSKGKLVEKIDSINIGTPDTSIHKIPAGITVMLYRKEKPGYLPKFEGQFDNPVQSNGIFKVGEGKTAIEIGSGGEQKAYVKFDKLLCNVFNDDEYYLRAVQPDSKNDEVYKDGPFEAPEQELRFEKPEVSENVTHFDLERTYTVISTEPPKSTISGQLVYQWPGDQSNTLRPLANEDFSIVVEYLFNDKIVNLVQILPNGAITTKLHLDGSSVDVSTGDNGTIMATGTTDSNGKFTIEAINLNTKGELGNGTSTTKEENYPFSTPVPSGIPDIKEQIIDPSDPSAIKLTNQLTGLESNSFFNYNDLEGSFGAQIQANQLNGMLNQGQGLGAALNLNLGYNIPDQSPNSGAYTTYLGASESMNVSIYNKDITRIHGPAVSEPEMYLNRLLSSGVIKRVYRIRVKNQEFYYNPEMNITVDPFKSVDVGPVTVMVKEANWKFTVTEKGKKKSLYGMNAIIFRDPSSKVKHLPQGEGNGLYEMKKLINPQQFADDVTIPGKNAVNANSNPSATPVSYWQQNQEYYADQKLSESQIFGSQQTWEQNSYEWIDSDETDQGGVVDFDRITSGFKNYYIEITSNSASGNLFYKYIVKPLQECTKQYEDDVRPENNALYGNYWDTRQKDIPQINVNMYMEPEPSRIAGRVIDQSTELGIKVKSLVILTDSNEKFVSLRATDSKGYYEFLNVFDFPNVPKGVSNFKGRLRANAPGFKQVKESGNMDYREASISKTGQQNLADIHMVPSAILTGFIKNEQGEAVDSYIKREDGKTVETIGFNAGLVITSTKGKFTLPIVAINQEAVIYIIPKDPGYFIDTLELSNLKEGINDIGVHKVFRREHRMHFIITDASDTNSKLGNASIQINNQQAVLTNTSGEAEISFENVSVNNYTLKISGPEGKGYIPQVINLKNEETKSAKKYWIKLKKGGSINGIVTLDGKPVQGAKVYLDYKEQTTQTYSGTYQLNLNAINPGANNNTVGNAEKLGNGSLPQLITYSDVNGSYRLDGIPINEGQVDLIASLDTAFTVIGDKKNIVLKNGKATQNLALKSYGELLIQSIYGFPLTIESISPTSDKNVVKVTGIVKLEKSNSPFAWLIDDQSLRVANVPFTKKKVNGKNIGKPVDDQTNLDAVTGLKMQYLNKYNVQITHDNNPGTSSVNELTIEIDKENKGEMNGYARIVDNSFNYPSSYLNFKDKDQFFLSKITNAQIANKIAIFKAIGTDEKPVLNPSSEQLLTKEVFHLSNKSGKPIQFNFIQFDASAEPKNSFIDPEGKIHLDVSMDCSIPNAQPENISVHAGDIVLDNEKVYPADGAEPLSVKLEDWDLEISNWKIDPLKGGIYSENGLVKTGKLDIPFKEFNLRSDMFVMDKFEPVGIELGGGVKLLSGVTSKNTLIVYDNKCGSDMSGHWKIAIAGDGNNPAAKIEDFESFLNQDINIQNVQLLSNGEDIFSIQQSQDPYVINANEVAKFFPETIASGKDFFTISGSLEIPAPRIIPISTTLKFTKPQSSLEMVVVPVQMSFEGQGYVKFTADDDDEPIIENDRIVINGNVEEENGFNPIKATFYADGNSPAIASYHVDLEKDFVLNLTSKSSVTGSQGKFNLKIDHGGMKVPIGANDWDLLSFSGNLLTTDPTLNAGTGGGKENNKMTFTVIGDINVSGDAVKVSKIGSPFGEMTMVYDFNQKALYGTIAVNDQSLGPFSVGGTVDMLMDPQGWYFLGVGEVKTGLPGPLGNMNMGFLLGNRPITSIETNKVSQYSYDKSSLCWLIEDGGKSAISGLFITAGKSILDKELGFNYAIASFYLRAKAGAEASLYTDFNDWSLMMSAGLYGEVAAGASILGVSASGSASLNGSLTGAVSSKSFCIGGDVGVLVKGTLSVYNPVGPDPSTSITEHAGVELQISSSSGFDADFYLGSGGNPPSCNAQSTCNN